ncbi:hypothetical protein ASPACDRAFT_42453 [Aspergillus aculeatus ATCC 16872]|uniref:Ubiquitin 3 binding protein But2 C-terminal domain-containing protein n=1 Tax=Aspergillus aculeatus (strain ATCC 16872 / CBS 172.66 / WB 5094) TaxID=690307 RepID=A0A1L9WXT5_ASPA1|nr:uncharacterized protein ASPACDRAFT_42453 [Aspergillus aculeatus ATCC 16872]OJK00953.1 hypothetical protein ASPACDRAFT_42453 [Aspergillus aculeatus ATCC 16872]
MHFLSESTVLFALASSIFAAPLAVRTQTEVQITFLGAADAQFTQSFPTDGSTVAISNPLSISHIASSTAGVTCTFIGIDHSSTTVSGVATVDVGPPQTQTQGSCTAAGGSTTPTPAPAPVEPSTPSTPSGGQGSSVTITFQGAADAQFSQSFPLDGTSTAITNPLSISHIVSSTGNVRCTFNGIDHSVTTVSGVQTIDVGPPQTQVNGACTAA